tara:strand:+ start:59 stop:349 length:291 start_codon:yes stop_codon:yes gene_type:complete
MAKTLLTSSVKVWEPEGFKGPDIKNKPDPITGGPMEGVELLMKTEWDGPGYAQEWKPKVRPPDKGQWGILQNFRHLRKKRAIPFTEQSKGGLNYDA